MQNTVLPTDMAKSLQFRKRVRAILGLLTGLTGLINMLTIIFPKPNWNMLLGVWTLDGHHGAHKLLAVVGFFLVMLSYSMVRGKRQAWIATTILLLLSVLLSILSGGSVFAGMLMALLVLLVVSCARHFRAKSDPPTLRRGYIALLAGLGIVTLYSISGLFAFSARLAGQIERLGFVEVWLRLLTNSHLPHFAFGTEALLFGHVLPVLCLSAVFYGMGLILRPVAAEFLPNEQEQRTARALTRRYGANTISYFALAEEKSFFFSTSKNAFISYVLEGNVAVVVGDPIGPEEEILPTIEQFLSFCHEQDWSIAFWQGRKAYADLYRQAGMHLVKIGEDPMIATETFTLVGKAMGNVRTSARHAEKAGLQVVFHRGQVRNPKQLAQMEQISRSWLASKNGTEMGFSMGCFEREGDAEQVYALAVDADNRVYAFLSFVPIYGRKGWGIDLMRRTAQVPGGTMELLIARSIDYLKANGAETVSLGLAPMSNFNQSDELFLESGMDFLAHFVGDLSKKGSLSNFKKKFQPQWESRYLVCSSKLSLPRAGWAVYRAHQRDVSVSRMLYRALRKWRATRREVRLECRAAALARTVEVK